MSREREEFGEYYEIVKKIKKDQSFETTPDHVVMGIKRHVAAPPLPLGTTLNTVTPCAACKLLRRRCAEECPFSPYFSPHEPHKFAAVHKVFGASNVSKMLLEVGESQRGDAANSLVYEANLRLRDPVYGCMGAISALHHHINSLQSQLSAVRTEILRHKYRQANNNNNNFIITSSTSVSDAQAALALLLPSGLASPPPPLRSQMNSAPPPLTPPPSLPSPSIVVSSSSTSSNSSATNSMYNPPSSAAGFNNSMSSDNNLHFFD